MAQKSLLIENAHCVDPSQELDRIARILIVDGVIQSIDPSDGDLPSGVERLEATDLMLLPGLVDLATELREPGFEEDETIESIAHAALAGGFTTLVCTSSANMPLDSAAAIQFVRQKAADLGLVNLHLLGSVSKQRKGEQLAEIGSLVDAGAIGLSDAPRPLENTALLKRALEYCSMFEIPILDHPEIRSLSENGVMHEGMTQLILGLRPMPAEAEDLATARDLRLVEATGGLLHLTSVSTEGSIEICRRTKARSLAFTVGIHIANTHLVDKELRSFDSNCKVNPPFRSVEHVEACLAGLADGTIDVISSGHRPRSLEKKMQELDQAPFGMNALETCLAQAITFLVEPGVLSWSALVEKLALNPAKRFGLDAGTLQCGRSADVILVDAAESWTVRGREFVSRSSNTPLEGHTLRGRVTQVFRGGEAVLGRT